MAISSIKPPLILSGLAASVIFLSACEQNRSLQSDNIDPISKQSSAQNVKNNPEKAKNLILFIGDGMGVSTITAARIFDGQSKGQNGEENQLAFEDFKHLALVKTYNINAQVPDSAGTATAILSGFKTNIGAINVRPNTDVKKMVFNDCVAKRKPKTLLKRARKAGLSTGLITTTRITHATPAAFYGHSVSRDWEQAADIDPRAAKFGCTSLADQLLKAMPDMVLGGGREKFTQEQLESWQSQDGHIFADTAQSFRQALTDPDLGQKTLFALFSPSHMSYEADRDNAKEPSLAEMTEAAIKALSNRGTGYVLLVEAGRVDHAHHGTNAFRAMRDMQALNEAVKIAKTKTGNDTLIMVTADHSHVFTISGYPARGNPILGLVRSPDPEAGQPAEDFAKDLDGKPYTTLGYANGPNIRHPEHETLDEKQVLQPDYQQHSTVRLGSETHAGEDVPLYARGPGADQVRGVIEQDQIAHIIDQALGLK